MRPSRALVFNPYVDVLFCFVSRLQKLRVDLAKSVDALQIWGQGEGDDLSVCPHLDVVERERD